MKRIKRFKILLLFGSIFLIYIFSHKLFGAEQKITSPILEKIQGEVKDKLFDVLAANELTTKDELDVFITNSQQTLDSLKNENLTKQPIIQITAQEIIIPEPMEITPTPSIPVFPPEPTEQIEAQTPLPEEPTAPPAPIIPAPIQSEPLEPPEMLPVEESEILPVIEPTKPIEENLPTQLPTIENPPMENEVNTMGGISNEEIPPTPPQEMFIEEEMVEMEP